MNFKDWYKSSNLKYYKEIDLTFQKVIVLELKEKRKDIERFKYLLCFTLLYINKFKI